ncbi:sensor histidine kinase [Microbacterium sp. CIAB417]|uniref:sensor histidine kinase n=1 Tax=Microbacterium sp. CIAB417 TaxID=2860287 RepID=UPI001FAE2CDD|nr:histidine kinase [Microbacterium sp. CIAB417]
MRSPTPASAGLSNRSAVGQVGRVAVGTVAGIVLVPVLLVALAAAPIEPAGTVAGWIGRRLTWIDGVPRTVLPHGGRRFGLLAVFALLGVLTACIVALIVLGMVVSTQMTIAAITGGPVILFEADPGRVTWSTLAIFAVPGLVLLFLAVSGIAGIAWLERQTWKAFTRPGVEELAQEVNRLHTTLDDVVAAVDTERRRIERDIHDGVQQRVVALSILLARAERASDPQDRVQLHRRSREEAQQILDDLRDVAWRTYPAMLARDGLAAALEALRDRTSIPVRLDVEHDRIPDHAVETAAYFVASEAVTNVVKHANSQRIDIRSRLEGDRLIVTVSDDGVGGANPEGPGLSGIASRVAARGGRLLIDSPVGGPTKIEAEIPCG